MNIHKNLFKIIVKWKFKTCVITKYFWKEIEKDMITVHISMSHSVDS